MNKIFSLLILLSFAPTSYAQKDCSYTIYNDSGLYAELDSESLMNLTKKIMNKKGYIFKGIAYTREAFGAAYWLNVGGGFGENFYSASIKMWDDRSREIACNNWDTIIDNDSDYDRKNLKTYNLLNDLLSTIPKCSQLPDLYTSSKLDPRCSPADINH